MNSIASAVTADLSSMDLSVTDTSTARVTEATETSLREVVFYGLAFGSATMSSIVIGFTSVGPFVAQVSSLFI